MHDADRDPLAGRLASLQGQDLATILKSSVVESTRTKRLGSFLSSPSEVSQSLTFEELIYSIARFDPSVIAALDLTDTRAIARFLAWPWTGRELACSNLSCLLAQQMQAQGFEALVELGSSADEQVMFGGTRFICALHLPFNDVKVLLERNPGRAVYVSEAVGLELGEIDGVYVFNLDSSATSTGGPAASTPSPGIGPDLDEVLDWSSRSHFMPSWIYKAVHNGRQVADVLRGDLVAAGKAKILEEVANQTAGQAVGFIGAKVVGALGFCFFGPAGGLVGGAVGDRLGKAQISRATDWLKEKTLLRAQSSAVVSSVSSFLHAALPVAESTLSVFADKKAVLENSVSIEALKPLETTFRWKLKDEWAFRERKLGELRRAARDPGSLSQQGPLGCADEAALLVRQTGVHGHAVRSETADVKRAVGDFLSARKRYGLG